MTMYMSRVIVMVLTRLEHGGIKKGGSSLRVLTTHHPLTLIDMMRVSTKGRLGTHAVINT